MSQEDLVKLLLDEVKFMREEIAEIKTNFAVFSAERESIKKFVCWLIATGIASAVAIKEIFFK